MTKKTQTDQPYKLMEAARKLGVDHQTLRRAINQGKIRAHRLTERGHFLIPRDEIDRLLRGGK